MKRILVLGASGLLGSRIGLYLKDFDGTYFKAKPKGPGRFYFLDMNEFSDAKQLLKTLRPEIVINCTGITNVEICEQYPEKCWSLNCASAVNIAQICKSNSVKYVHISTDHFMHKNLSRLSEIDEISASNQYSYSKLSAEKLINHVNQDSLIVRTNFFQINFAQPRTFLDKLILNVKSGVSVYSFKDVIFTPVSIKHLIYFLIKLIEKDVAGVVNIGSDEKLSKYDFHKMVLNSLELDNNLHFPIRIDEFSHLAKRPNNMTLCNKKLKSLVGDAMPSLYDMINDEIEFSRQGLE